MYNNNLEKFRSVLYLPADNRRFIEKAPSLGADLITLDLEDTIPPEKKAGARITAAEGLSYIAASNNKVYVRVNGWDTGLTEADLDSVITPGLSGVTLPKTATPEDVLRLEDAVADRERHCKMEEGTVKICLVIESALGVQNAYSCCKASKRVSSVIFGAMDYSADMGLKLTEDEDEIFFGRASVALAARAAGAVAIDGPFQNFANLEGFERSTIAGKKMGYKGRLSIHPCQIKISNRLYAPTAEEAQHAERVINCFENEGLARGKSAVSLDGKFIDLPVYNEAKRVLEEYRNISDD